ncbi:23S ribosomal RNA methyltransferase Erm [Paenibacillus sp. S150]|uniref:23S ribosomal RNA methyltransferase Erm n=1 Tax=Paenibacillus sp. S150 TaxID=2749826 RepID=UPI001C5820F1|nr:23S ribosomal RNA methyltransferase Erm [Paenibacillus sp. S150]MBW4080154.1 23S ribosomal RNA methyltransferase Erm [Paenibacillus sp. S150]
MRYQNKRHRKIRKCTVEPNFSGQHFLHNRQTIREIIRISCLQPGDTVLEIGAGKGALTFSLAAQAGNVIAVEQDKQFIEPLREKAKDYPGVNIVRGDFRMMKLPDRPFCVVANIPFSITTPILEKLLGAEGSKFQRGTFLMEKGAAIRFTASATADPRLLAWRMNHRLDFRGTVPRTHFAPPPRVDGAIVTIVRREKLLLPHEKYYRFCAFAAFLLRNSRSPLREPLGGIFTATQMAKVLREAQASRGQSAAELSVQQWAILFQAMLRHVQPYRWPR